MSDSAVSPLSKVGATVNTSLFALLLYMDGWKCSALSILEYVVKLAV